MKAVLLAAGLVLAASQATAAQCEPYRTIVDKLKVRFGESRRAVGTAADRKFVMEVYAAPGGGWTILLTSVDGMACVIATGEDFDMWSAPAEGDGS